MELSIKYSEANIVDAYWEKLQSLSTKAKLRLASLLTTSVLEEEVRKEKTISAGRRAKVLRRATSVPSDAELQAQFADKDVPEVPEDPEWSQVISANTGRTIKPVEKWL